MLSDKLKPFKLRFLTCLPSVEIKAKPSYVVVEKIQSSSMLSRATHEILWGI